MCCRLVGSLLSSSKNEPHEFATTQEIKQVLCSSPGISAVFLHKTGPPGAFQRVLGGFSERPKLLSCCVGDRGNLLRVPLEDLKEQKFVLMLRDPRSMKATGGVVPEVVKCFSCFSWFCLRILR